jgi:hypothetical protein
MIEQKLDQSSSTGEDKWYYDALERLRQEISCLADSIRKSQNALLLQYPEEALRQLSASFVEIGLKFIGYTRKKKGIYYRVLDRSERRMSAAMSIIESSKQAAMFFEHYANSPQSYSQAESKVEMGKVLADLENLEDFCEHQT